MNNITNESFDQVFSEVLQQNGLESFITPMFTSAFAGLCHCLSTSKHNVTAIRQTDEVCAYHFADSLVLAQILGNHSVSSLLDVGSGGGFPALPLAIAHSNLHITALDSTAKKLEFVSQTAATLKLSNISTLSGRGEELAHKPEYRESFDIVTARGVAHLTPLSELCLPFLKIGGVFAAMKGDGGEDELDSAKGAILKLGGEIEEVHDYILSCGEEKRQRKILIIRKKINTIKKYPRSWKSIMQGF